MLYKLNTYDLYLSIMPQKSWGGGSYMNLGKLISPNLSFLLVRGG